MTTLLTKLFRKNERAQQTTGGLEFIRFKKNLINSLILAHKAGTAVGIYSNVLGDGMFVTGIEDIYDYEDDYIIHLKRYDVLGTILIRNTISLSEIKAVCV